ncbi:MAG: Gfo/Idh/MocA family oxidoreductase [Phycisphaerae bacterium]|nr:Gfo/Idh/MocA family oxidoreductase [Phycisphaerae bacterium]
MATSKASRKINLAIIGAGGISQAVHLPGFKLCKDVRVAALCDESESLARRVAEPFGVPAVYSDYQRMLESEPLDAVVVATPNYLHYPMVMAAAQRKLHVLCEKPLALDATQARRMRDAVKRARLVNMIAYNYRYVPAIRFLKQLIDDGTLGRVYHFRAFYLQLWGGDGASWRTRRKLTGSGQLGDVGSHLIDYARHLIGEFDSVCGLTRTWLPKRRDPNTNRWEKTDVDDAASFMAEFKNGAAGVFEVTRFAPGRGCGLNEHQSIEINAEGGTVVYDYQKPDELQLCLTQKDMAAARFVRTSVPAAVRQFYGPAIWKAFRQCPPLGFRLKQARDFIDAIRHRRSVTPNFDDALRAQQVIDAILQADRSRRWVKVPR